MFPSSSRNGIAALVTALLLVPSAFAFSTRILPIKSTTVGLQQRTKQQLNAVVVDSSFEFNGHKIYAETSKPDSTTGFSLGLPKGNLVDVILIHGFGCSTYYWREKVTELTKAGYTVHALDLLGQGMSAKPGRKDGVEYSIDLWADIVDQYARRQRLSSVVLMGNSLGSVVALSAATGDFAVSEDESAVDVVVDKESCYLRSKVAGIGMFNCGIGMNSRNILKDESFSPLQKFVFTRLFDLLDGLIFGNTLLLTYILDKVVTRDFLKKALTNLYACAESPDSRVDEALVDAFFTPAQDKGAVEALSQIYTNDPGRTPMEIYQRHKTYMSKLLVHLVWGSQDGVTPLNGPVGQFFQRLSDEPQSVVSLDVIESGHVPFDEVPEIACGSMLKWLDTTVSTTSPFPALSLPSFGR